MSALRADMARTLAIAGSHGDQTGEAGVLALSALGEAYEGDTDAAGRFADAAAGLVDGLTDPNLTDLCESLVWLAWAEALLERYDDVERHADRGVGIARRSGQLHVLPHLLTTTAYLGCGGCRRHRSSPRTMKPPAGDRAPEPGRSAGWGGHRARSVRRRRVGPEGPGRARMNGQARSSVVVIRDSTPHDHRKSCLLRVSPGDHLAVLPQLLKPHQPGYTA